MSDNKEPKVLSKEVLQKQIKESESFIQQVQNQISQLQQQLQQQLGVLGYSQHLLKQFDIPSVPEKPKTPEIEVK